MSSPRYFDVCRKLIGLFWCASFLLEKHQGPALRSPPTPNTSDTLCLPANLCLSISTSICEESVVGGTREWLTVSVGARWGLRTLYRVSPWVLDHARFFLLVIPSENSVNLSLVFEEQANKRGARKAQDQGMRKESRRQGPEAAGSHLLESPPQLSPVKAKEAPSPVHFP